MKLRCIVVLALALRCVLIAVSSVESPLAAQETRDAVVAASSENDGALQDETSRRAFKKAFSKNRVPWRAKDNSIVYLPPKPEKETTLKEPRRRSDSLFGSKETWELILKFIFWICCAIVFFLVVGVLFFIARRLWLQKSGRFRSSREAAARARRLETLAPEAASRYDDLLQAASEAYAQGDLRSAVVFYFSWTLVEMDKREFILLDKGKTNMEFWRELEEFPNLRAIYRDVMAAFERVYFGGESITREQFERVWILREPFERAMAERDAELARAKEESSQSSSQQGSVPNFTILLILWLAFSPCLGCARYWKPRYQSPCSSMDSLSLNSTTIFAKYLAERGNCEVKETSNGSLARNAESQSDVIIWCYSAPSYSLGVLGNFWGRGDPVSFASLNMRWSAVNPRASDGPNDALEKAFRANLERYAEADASDLTNFTTTSGTAAFQNERESILDWLREKPNRTFVFVDGFWDARPFYLRDSLNSLEVQAVSPKNQKAEQSIRDDIAMCRFSLDAYQRVFDANNWLKDEFDTRKKYANETLNALRSYDAVAEGLRDAASDRSNVTDLNDDLDEDDEIDFEPFENESESSSERSLDSFFDDAVYYQFQSRGFNDGVDWDESDDVSKEIPLFVSRLSSDLFRVDDSTEDLTIEREATFSGDPEWTRGLPKTGRLREFTRLEPRDNLKTVLALGDYPLICEQKVGDSRLFVVSSNSFLTNFGLGDLTNQIIADRLASQIPANSKVAFCNGRFDASRDELTFLPQKLGPFSLARFTPFTIFVWHAFFFSALVVFVCYPIFGRPKKMANELTNDFSRHVDAYARELQNINAVEWTQEQIDKFRNSDVKQEL